MAVKVSKNGPAFTECGDSPLFEAQEWEELRIAEAVAADAAPASDFGELFPQFASPIGLAPQRYGAADTRSEIRKISDDANSMEQIAHFAQTGA